MSDSYFKEVKNLFYKMLDINFNSCYSYRHKVTKETKVMALVQIPSKHFNQVIADLTKYPVCHERYLSLNVQWNNCTIDKTWFEPEQPGHEGEIPENGEGSLYVSMGDEVNKLGNSDCQSESDEFLYSLLSALAKYNPRMSGRSTPSLGSSNDYQRGRD